MAKIFYVTNGMSSTLNSSFELSRRLRAYGHSVTYVSDVDLRQRVEDEGYPFTQLTAIKQIFKQQHDYARTLQSKNYLTKIRHLLTSGVLARQRSLEVDELENLIHEQQPELLIIDNEMHHAILSCIPLGIPIALPIVWFSIFRSPELPPMHTLLPPAHSYSDRLKIKIAWWKMLAARCSGQFVGWAKSFLPRKRVQLVEYQNNERHNLRALANVKGVNLNERTDWTQWLKPHTYRDVPVICMNAFEMEFPHRPPENLFYVGPMVHETRSEDQVPEDQQKSWEEFKFKCEKEQKQIVYCSLGTFLSTNVDFLNKVIDVFRRNPDWALVIGLGGKSRKTTFENVPENVLVMGFAPQLQILKASSAAITHGGITSINECIWFEVPMLVCSTSHGDQDGCAARVQYYRLGKSADISKSKSRDVEAYLSDLLGDTMIRDNVAAMRKHFQRYQDEQTAEKLVESLLD